VKDLFEILSRVPQRILLKTVVKFIVREALKDVTRVILMYDLNELVRKSIVKIPDKYLNFIRNGVKAAYKLNYDILKIVDEINRQVTPLKVYEKLVKYVEKRVEKLVEQGKLSEDQVKVILAKFYALTQEPYRTWFIAQVNNIKNMVINEILTTYTQLRRGELERNQQQSQQ